jgi:hypothetical protein
LQRRGRPYRKLSTDPREIPHGYSAERHRALAGTIADATGNLAAALGAEALRVMACHEHPEGREAHCVGWLANQLGPGNNIALRMSVRDCDNIHRLRLDGPQHQRFEDTLPAPRKPRVKDPSIA